MQIELLHSCHRHQCAHFGARETPRFSPAEAGACHGTVCNPIELEHFIAKGFEHPADLPVPPLVDGNADFFATAAGDNIDL